MVPEDGVECAHDQMGTRGFTVTATLPISNYLQRAPACAECSILLQAVEAYRPGWIDANKDLDAGGVLHLERKDVYTVELRVMEDPEQKNVSYFNTKVVGSFQLFHRSGYAHFYEDEVPEEEFGAGDRVKRPKAQCLNVVRDTSSQEAMDRAAHWLSHCVENDEACQLPNHDDFAPRRLIDVGAIDGSSEPLLIETDTETAGRDPKRYKYACLSYCWGSDVNGVLTTTRENLASHYESIPLATMPAGIQDAVRVCRGLKIPYLWIDSLCIVQDDDGDWREEAARMGAIYLHSHLTIAAVEPGTCKQPFLGRQAYAEPTWQRQLVAEYMPKVGPDPVSLEIFIREDIVDTQSDCERDRSSLNKRGWCFQEGLLPNRRLCFDGNEMTWECLCRQICECGHILWQPQKFRFGELGSVLKSSLLKASPVRTGLQPCMGFLERLFNDRIPEEGSTTSNYRDLNRWRNLVTEYTGRSLTRQTDKFTALSGLAKLVGESLPGAQTGLNALRRGLDPGDEVGPVNEYLAGLWRGEFLLDLAWIAANPTTRIKGIPTWSWASVQSQVRYNFDEPLRLWQNQTRLIHCAAAVKITAPTTYLTDVAPGRGHAVLKGARVPIRLATTIVDGDIEAHVTTCTPPYYRAEVFLDDYDLLHQAPRVAKDSIEAERLDGLYCFRLFSWHGSYFKDRMGLETWFLVLRQSTAVTGAFE